VVIANIIDGVLMEIKKHLWKKTKKGGYLILSGILTAGARAFEKDFIEGNKVKVIRRLEDEEWTSLLISK
jgi:ribosomal protein L11 methyltransferase